MKIIIPTNLPTQEQKKSKIQLTEMVSKRKLKKNPFSLEIIEKLEQGGFAFVISNSPKIYYSVLMPSGEVLDVLRYKRLLYNMPPSNSNNEINGAYLYYELMMGLCKSNQ